MSTTLFPGFIFANEVSSISDTKTTTSLVEITEDPDEDSMGNTGTVSLPTSSGTIQDEDLPQEPLEDTMLPLADTEDTTLDTQSGSTHTGELSEQSDTRDEEAIIVDTDEDTTSSNSTISESKVDPENAQKEEILVQFHSDIDGYVGSYQVEQLAQANNLQTTDIIAENNIAVMSLDELNTINNPMNSIGIMNQFVPTEEEIINELIVSIKQDPRVAHVQKNFIYTIQSVNDPDFSKLWGLHNEGQSNQGFVGTPDADIDYPEAIAYASGRLGTGVIVAVLDTGIAYNHPDLRGNMWNGQNCLSDTGAYIGGCIHGYDFANNDKDPQEGTYLSHGTHVAGTIGAITNNGTGIVGIAPNVTLMAVKVCNNGCSTSDIIRGINFARYNGAKVINASFGRGGYTPKTVGEFDYLTYETIQNFPGLFVAAAGNDGLNSDTGRFYPAGFGTSLTVSGEGISISGEVILSGEVTYPGLQNTIAVAASDENDNLASFSNYGTGTVHIAAPGTSIYSTYRTVSSETDYMTDGWIKTGGSHSGIFLVTGSLSDGGYMTTDDMRMTISGESLYASGQVASIEKVFTSDMFNSAYLRAVTILCDTPDTGTWKDYISIGHDAGDGYIEDKKIDEAYLKYNQRGDTRTIDGRIYSIALVDGSLFDTPNPTFKIRISWHTDNIDDIDPSTGRYYGGCRIQDGLTINKFDDGKLGEYAYLAGTSMAAPHVAGAAALAMSYAPHASLVDIKNAILRSSDYKSQLSDKIMYGRLNVANMLKGLEKPTITSTKVTLSGESGAKIQLRSNVDNDSIWKYITVSKNPNFYGTSGILPQIETLYANGIISSRSEDRLGDNVTRAESAGFLARIGGYSPTTCIGILTDVGSGLGDLCGYIESLAQNNVISTGGLYRPNAITTYGEFYKILVRTAGEQPSLIGDSEPERYANRIGELGCGGISLMYDSVITRYDLIHMSVCIFGLDDVTDTRWLIQRYGQDTIDVIGLSPDTTYYYYTEVSSTIFRSGSRFAYQSFRTPKIIPQISTETLTSSGGVLYMSGSTATGIIYSQTGTAQKIILSDSGATAKVELSLTGLTLVASGSWDGLFYAPNLVATNTGITLSDGSRVSVENIYEIGSATSSLSLSGKLATITIASSKPDGTVYRVYRSDDMGVSFSDISSCTVVGGNCSFTTDHFSQFTIGSHVSPSVPNPTSGGSGGGSGGGGASASTTINPADLFGGKLLFHTIYGSGKVTESGSGKMIKNTPRSPKDFGKMIVFLSVELVSPSIDTRKNIESILLESIQTHGTTKLKRLVMFDRSLTAINRMLKEYPTVQSSQHIILLNTKKRIERDRRVFIWEEVFGR